MAVDNNNKLQAQTFQLVALTPEMQLVGQTWCVFG